MPHEENNGEGGRMAGGYRHVERRRPLFSFVLSLGRYRAEHSFLCRAMHVLFRSNLFGQVVFTLQNPRLCT